MDAVQNVVVVVIDALRADRVTAYGCEKELTPNIDELASDGIVFENAFTHSPNTDPSLTSIHTGKYPSTTVSHHGHFVTDEEKQRVEAAPWVPEILSDHGWNTVTAGRPMGRWHRNGFDTYPSPGVKRKTGSILRSIHPRVHGAARRLYKTAKDIIDPDREKSDSLAARQYVNAVDTDPFYLFVHLMDTHTGYEPSEQLIDEMLEAYDYPGTSLEEFFAQQPDDSEVQEYMERWITDRDREEGLGRVLARYDAAVVEADRKVGLIVDELKERGVWEETALLVLSDHGEALGEHGIYFSHHGLYEPTLHVPLVARIPGVDSQQVAELVQLTDIAPTVLSLLDIDTDISADGQDLTPLFTGAGDWEPRDAVHARETFTHSRSCIRTAAWKYIRQEDDETMAEFHGDSLRCGRCGMVHGAAEELYDLEADPAEEENLVEEQPGTAAELSDRLDAFQEGLSYPDTAGEAVQYDDEEAVKERLEDLGYM
ncbi:MAG: sulfatase [Candidatus Nanohaloarchaea archaeon]|nr:sulfatase [Candidatus Nanohaloarchaea archaeon]